MRPSQRKTLKRIIRYIKECRDGRSGTLGYECKRFAIRCVKREKIVSWNRQPGNLYFIRVIVGLPDDEGTMAEIFGRSKWHYMIGAKGGLQACNRRGTWVRGRKALFTGSN